MKIFLFGNNDVKQIVSGIKGATIVDAVQDLNMIDEVIEFIDVDFLVLDCRLDGEPDCVFSIARKAKLRDIKIILILDKLDINKEFIDKLVELGVYAHVDTSGLNITSLVRFFNSYPSSYTAVSKTVKEETNKIVIHRTLRQQVISFVSSNSTAKADIMTQLAVLMSIRSGQRILLVNLDPFSCVPETLFGVSRDMCIEKASKNLKTLSDIEETPEGNLFKHGSINEFVCKDERYPTLSILPWLYDVKMLRHITHEYVVGILDELKRHYDTIFIDTLFGCGDISIAAIESATNVVAIVDNNKAAVGATHSYLESLLDMRATITSRIKLIVNDNYAKASKDVYETLFNGIDILGIVPKNDMRDIALALGSIFITTKKAKSDLNSYLEILENLGYIQKQSTFGRLFGKNSAADSICTQNLGGL